MRWSHIGAKVGLHHSKQFLRLGRVKVSVIALFHTEVVQRVVAGGGKAMASKAALHAYQGAAVKRDDGASGFGGLEQVRHIAGDSGAVFGFVETAALLGRLTEVWDQLDGLRGVWTFEPTASGDDRVRTLADVLAQPAGDDAVAAVQARLAEASADELASIIYTSGTTGEPRGAALTHRGFTFELDALDAIVYM